MRVIAVFAALTAITLTPAAAFEHGPYDLTTLNGWAEQQDFTWETEGDTVTVYNHGEPVAETDLSPTPTTSVEPQECSEYEYVHETGVNDSGHEYLVSTQRCVD